MESLREFVVEKARDLHRKHEQRLKTEGLTAEQVADLRQCSNSMLVEFVKQSLQLDQKEALRVVEKEIFGTIH
jgi:hypothetical protein